MVSIKAFSRASRVCRISKPATSATSFGRLLHNTVVRNAISNFQMPAMSPTMTEGGIASWKKKEGEAFSTGDVLLEIETDKATIDVEAQDDGVMGKILLQDGSKNIPVGKVIALLAEEGDDISNLEVPEEEATAPLQLKEESSPHSSSLSPRKPESDRLHSAGTHEPHPDPHALLGQSRPLFPSVHRLLLEHNVTDPKEIEGTGVRGMLTKGDVLAFLGKASSPLGTFKPGPSPIEEASKLVEQKIEVVQTLDGAAIRRLIVSSMLRSSIKARNPPPDYKSADFDSVISDYLSKSSAKVTCPPSQLPKKPSKKAVRIRVADNMSWSNVTTTSTSVHDVRYFAALLRGVNFVNRATVTITQQGMTVTVEEARTLLGTAFIFSEVFDEYTYHAESSLPRAPRPPKHKRPQQDPNSSETESDSENETDKLEAEEPDNAAFEIPLNTLIECLNIFGTAGAMNVMNAVSGSSGGGGPSSNNKQAKKWRRTGDVDSDGEGRPGGRGLEAYFGQSAGEKKTGMRLSYSGAGYPLTLIIAEDAAGPTTTCEITTFDPEPQLELHYDNDHTVLKIIFKSSWLRDALSELDPSCERLTFIGNPPASAPQQSTLVGTSASENTDVKPKPIRNAAMKPMLRIQATGAFGSTEMDYPNDRDVLETFECTKSVSFSYRFGHISRTLRALQSSFKTSLRIDQDGLLSLQFLMPKPGRAGGGDAFIEFRCLALDDEF